MADQESEKSDAGPSSSSTKKKGGLRKSHRPQNKSFDTTSSLSMPPRRLSFQLPDRLKAGSDDEDEDVTAPRLPRGGGKTAQHAAQFMNQSVFGMIAAAGRGADFRARFDEGSSESDQENPREKEKKTVVSRQVYDEYSKRRKKVQLPEEDEARDTSRDDRSRTGRPATLSKSVPSLSLRKKKGSTSPTPAQTESMSTSQILPPEKPSSSSPSPRKTDDVDFAPVMGRQLTAQREAGFHVSPPSTPTQSQPDEGSSRDETSPSTSPSTKAATRGSKNLILAQRLQEIFGFKEPEEVVSEYPCWYLQSVLLQGYMYITRRHICFYAYLPKRTNVVAKSGYLSKRGKSHIKYTRYWFHLKGDILSYFDSPSNVYFPSGHIDLSYGISCNLGDTPGKVAGEGKDTSSTSFHLETDSKSYVFQADSHASAKEWVKHLQKVIFRSHQEGDSVKIAILIDNVIDVEENPVLDFAETVKIRAMEGDETYAVDEYFFSFFSMGDQAMKTMKRMIDAACEGDDEGDDSRHDQRDAIDREDQPSDDNDESAIDSDERGVPAHMDLMSGSQILERSDVFRPASSKIRKAGDRLHPLSEAMKTPMPRQSEDDASDDQDGGHLPARDTRRSFSSSDGRVAPFNYSSSNLKELIQHGVWPLQKATGVAEYVRNRSKRVSDFLASESAGYYQKMSGMWTGGKRHYGESRFAGPLDTPSESVVNDEDWASHGLRFKQHFGLPETETLRSTYYTWLHRLLPLYGKIYLSDHYFCFRSLVPGTKTKLVLPFRDLDNVNKGTSYRFGYAGLVVVIRGYEELFFDFNDEEARDDCLVTCLRQIEFLLSGGGRSILPDEPATPDAETAKTEHRLLQRARLDRHKLLHPDERPRTLDESDPDTPTILFDDPRASILNFKPTESLRITCLTIGSRGDVQPYIALCKGLIAEGHKPKIATHAEFEDWVRSHGIDFAAIDGDPAELMRICIENGMFTLSFLKEATSKFRGWLDDLFHSAWIACQGSDLLIESPSAMAGIHIAEALGIPYFRAFTMPWSRTRAYPHAFAVPENKMGGAYNYMSYVLFDAVFWKAIAGQVNRWRKKELSLPSTSLERMQANKVPFLYNFSPHVVVPPLDYSDWIRVTGYWFLDESDQWTPPKDLVSFIRKARQDGKKLVYVGFGSIVVENPQALTQTVVQAVQKADVRCILSKGWSDRLGKKDPGEAKLPLPSDIHQIKAAPHDWLFRQVDAVAHHGGAGTTGASLRAGVPTVIKPFFGDQFFFGTRVEDLGVGLCLKKINISVFARALWQATHDERMILKARALGEAIRKENGVNVAIQALYRDLEYAKSLIKQRRAASGTAAPADDAAVDNDDIYDTESWTFIGDESDPELSRRIADWEPMTKQQRQNSGSMSFSGSETVTRGSSGALGSMVLKGVKGA